MSTMAAHRAWPYVAPLVTVLAVALYGPLVMTLVLSVVDWDFSSAPTFAGVRHYADLFTQPEFSGALVQTVFLVAWMVPFASVLPMGLAILLWKRPGRTSAVYRALLFGPVVLAPVANAVSWQFVLNPLQGLANQALGLLGVAPVNWLGDPHTALPTIAVITVYYRIYTYGFTFFDTGGASAAAVVVTATLGLPLLIRELLRRRTAVTAG